MKLIIFHVRIRSLPNASALPTHTQVYSVKSTFPSGLSQLASQSAAALHALHSFTAHHLCQNTFCKRLEGEWGETLLARKGREVGMKSSFTASRALSLS